MYEYFSTLTLIWPEGLNYQKCRPEKRFNYTIFVFYASNRKNNEAPINLVRAIK